VGKEVGAGGVEEASIGTGQVKAEELGSQLSRGVDVVGGAVPTLGGWAGTTKPETL
jgi:hypothetical protein